MTPDLATRAQRRNWFHITVSGVAIAVLCVVTGVCLAAFKHAQSDMADFLWSLGALLTFRLNCGVLSSFARGFDQ